MATTITSITAGLVRLSLLRAYTDWPWLGRVAVAVVIVAVVTLLVMVAMMAMTATVGSQRARTSTESRAPSGHRW